MKNESDPKPEELIPGVESRPLFTPEEYEMFREHWDREVVPKLKELERKLRACNPPAQEQANQKPARPAGFFLYKIALQVELGELVETYDLLTVSK